MVLDGFGWFQMVSGSSQMGMDGFRPVTALVLVRFQLIVGGFGW